MLVQDPAPPRRSSCLISIEDRIVDVDDAQPGAAQTSSRAAPVLVQVLAAENDAVAALQLPSTDGDAVLASQALADTLVQSPHDHSRGVVLQRHIPPGLLVAPTANTVRLSRIQSPAGFNHSHPLDSIDAAVKSHFATRRLMRVGDFVTLTVDAACGAMYPEGMLIDETAVAFRVEQLECTGQHMSNRHPSHAFVDIDTAIFQSGAVKAFKSARACSAIATSAVTQLQSVLQSCIHPVCNALGLHRAVLLHGKHGSGRVTAIRAACDVLGLHIVDVNCHDLIGDTIAKTETYLTEAIHRCRLVGPCVLLLRHIHVLESLAPAAAPNAAAAHAKIASIVRELNNDTKSEFPIVMVAITHVPPDELNAALVSAFPHRIDMGVPNEAERAQLVRHFLARTVHGADVSAEYIAKMTAGFLPRDLQQLVTQSLRRAGHRALDCTLEPPSTTRAEQVARISAAGVCIEHVDVEAALEQQRQDHADEIGAPHIPAVQWADIGGLAHAKKEILETIQVFRAIHTDTAVTSYSCRWRSRIYSVARFGARACCCLGRQVLHFALVSSAIVAQARARPCWPRLSPPNVR